MRRSADHAGGEILKWLLRKTSAAGDFEGLDCYHRHMLPSASSVEKQFTIYISRFKTPSTPPPQMRMYTPFHASFRYVTIYNAELRTAVQRGFRILSFHGALRLIHGRQETIRGI